MYRLGFHLKAPGIALLISVGSFAQAPSPQPPPDPVVVQSNGAMHTQPWTEINRKETVALTGLREWAQGPKNDPNNLRLFLAGRILPKSAPTLISLSQNYLNFQLDVDEDRELWVEILSEARSAKNNLIPLSVGVNGGKQPFGSDVYVALNVYPAYTPVVVVSLIALLAGLIILGKSSSLLRADSSTSPYSLARFQMACWFYLVIATYLYIWLITGEYNNLPPSVLALIGISGGTGLAAIFIDTSKTQSSVNARKTLEAQEAALKMRIAEIASANPTPDSSLDQELQQKRGSLAETTANLAKLPAIPAAQVSKNWLQDILSDGDGVSFHRFQIVVWTVVLAGVFVRAVYLDLAMPDFNASLLGLMGISSGTYVGFKFPEKPK